MDAQGLLVFRAVAHAGSISAAARVLHVTQPAVTHHIRSLERSAGVPLLLRHARGVDLTAAGRQLLTRADEIARSLDIAERQMATLRRAETGVVRVVAFPSACATFVPLAVSAMRRELPGVFLSLDVLEPPDAVAALQQGEADLALLYDFAEVPAPPLPSSIVSEALFTDALHVVLAADHPLAGRPSVSVADLEDAEWIIGQDRGWEQLLVLAAGLPVKVAFAADDYVAMQAMAAIGRGVALLHGLVLAAVRRPDVATPLLRPTSRRSILMCHHADAGGLPAVAHTLQALRAASKEYK